jgi:penicillin-binding protein 1A
LKDSDRSVPTRKGDRLRRDRRNGGRRGKKKRARPGFFRRLVRSFLVVTLLATAGIGGVVAYYASRLPPMADWTVPKRAANVRILAASGALITNRGDTSGASLKLEEMPRYLPEAVIAIEDRRFYWHFGVDPIGLTRAIFTNLEAGGARLPRG